MSTYTEMGASIAARAFFYPSLLFNIARERLQEDWHWCDAVTEHVMLGAIPFLSMLDAEFQQLGVKAVVTLNEEFEIFISPEQYAAAGIAHLHLPTIDFLFAPPIGDLHRGADFIAERARRGELVYVHCKAGRGRSTALVLCYLIKEFAMTPVAALELVRAKRHQVRLAPGQWRSIQEFWQDCGCPGAGKDGIDGAVAAQVVAADTLNDSPAAAAAETLHADASAAAAAAETLNAEAPGTPDSVLGDRAAAFASTSTSEADTADAPAANQGARAPFADAAPLEGHTAAAEHSLQPQALQGQAAPAAAAESAAAEAHAAGDLRSGPSSIEPVLLAAPAPSAALAAAGSFAAEAEPPAGEAPHQLPGFGAQVPGYRTDTAAGAAAGAGALQPVASRCDSPAACAPELQHLSADARGSAVPLLPAAGGASERAATSAAEDKEAAAAQPDAAQHAVLLLHADAAEVPQQSAAEAQLPVAALACHSACHSTASSLDLERSASLVWVSLSAPSMDLADCQRPWPGSSAAGGLDGDGCRGSGGAAGGAAKAGRALPVGSDGGGAEQAASAVEVAADYVGGTAPAEDAAGCDAVPAAAGAVGCSSGNSSWYKFLPQSWVS